MVGPLGFSRSLDLPLGRNPAPRCRVRVVMKIIDIPQSGKCGLTVSFNGRNGQVRRAWFVPANHHTPTQLQVRSTLASQATRFRTLTTTEQNAWNTAAAQQQSASRLGSSGPLTGLQLFVKRNAALVLHGQFALDAPTARPTFSGVVPASA